MKTLTHMTLVAYIFNIYLVFAIVAPQTGWTYILPLDFVVKKTVSHSNKQIISIEQEVIFKSKTQPAEIKVSESWLIEGDKNLKVSAYGLGNYKENIRFNSLFNNKTKTQMIGNNKTTTQRSDDFYLHLAFARSTDRFLDDLKNMGIPMQTRLSRADGYICISIGEASKDEKVFPQIWIDQDQFLIRKIRLPSGTEVTLSNYVKINPDTDQEFWIAKKHIIKWGQEEVTVEVKNISTKTTATLQSFFPKNLDTPSELSFSSDQSGLAQIVEDFYSRFR